MRITGVSMVRNESDIIEAFVRHNLQFLDRLIVIDNVSSDSTRAILETLARETGRVEVQDERANDHRQTARLSATLRQLAADGAADVIAPLDADEFIVCESRAGLEASLRDVGREHCALVPWRTYVPTPSDDWSEVNPVRRIVNRRVREQPARAKVMVHAEMATAPGFRLAPGNHGVLLGEHRVPLTYPAGVALAHFPVRHPDQLLAKIVIGAYATRSRSTRLRTEAEHWLELEERLRREPRLAPAQLAEIAAGYAAEAPVELVRDPLPVAAELQYAGMIDLDPLKRILDYCGEHFSRIDRRPLQTAELAVARTRLGLVMLPDARSEAGRSLREYGEWAAFEVSELARLVQPGDNVVDVGADIGLHALACARRARPDGRVFAFEPRREAYPALCTAAALNSLPNLVALPYQLGERSDLANVTTPRATLDSLGLPAIRLIRFSEPSAAKAALPGARGLLARDRPLVFFSGAVDETRPLLESLPGNYRCYRHSVASFNPRNYYRSHRNIFTDTQAQRSGLLAVPDEAQPDLPESFQLDG